jgi:hypothetical protein
MFSNDIVGASQAHDGTKPDPHTLRMFLEGIPTNATADDVTTLQTVGGENDGKSRQLGRYIQEVAPFDPDQHERPADLAARRYLRGTDSLSFQGHGALSGTNLTTLSWDANPESNIAGYEVVQRETTVPDWTSAIPVGNVTTVTLDISKDNVQFGLRAVDTDGNRSPVAFPQVAA